MRLENWLYTIPLRLRSLVRRGRLVAELDEELRDHIERQVEENMKRGMSAGEARLAAARALGNSALIRDRTHATWAGASVERLWQDMVYAVRSARRAPLLSVVAIVALALGIGLNTGVFTMLNAMFLRPPTLVDAGSYVQIVPRYTGWYAGMDQFSTFTTEDFDAIRSRAHGLSDVTAWREYVAPLDQGKTSADTLMVTCNYFHVLGIDRPLLGRFFAAGECTRGAGAQVAVLTEPLWRSHYGADPQIVGKTIHLGGIPLVVIGVMPLDAANFMLGGIIVPYTLQPQLERAKNLFSDPDTPWLYIAGRLPPGFTREDAKAELTAIMSQQDRVYVERRVTAFNRKTSLVLTNGSYIENPALKNVVVGLMVLILGPLALILLLACSNVTMLFLSRTVVRSGEIAIRLALGVSRSRLAGMLLMESLMTVCIGGALGMILAYRVPQWIIHMIDPAETAIVVLVRPDWRVFGYLAILAGAATVISSLMPIRAAWKLDLLTALKGREGAATVRSRTTSGLIIVQVALSFVLICAAVFFGRIPSLMKGMNPGFEIHHTLSVRVAVDTSSGNRAKALAFYRSLESRIIAIPGVQSLAYASVEPFNRLPPEEIRLPGEAKGKGQPVEVDDVSSSFFSVFDIRVLRGRPFLATDVSSTGANPVAVVSKAFAQQFWPRGDPVGKVMVTTEDRHLTVVGVVADLRSERFGEIDGPRLYTLRGPSDLGGYVYVRFTGSAKATENAVRDEVRSLDPTQMIAPQTIWEALEAGAEQVSSLVHIVFFMASIALLMAVTGVYGVLSFAVNQRTREFGIKMVLGADRGAIFRSVILRAIRTIVIGLIGGVALAEPAMLLLNRLLARSALPLHAVDLTVFGVSAAVLATVSLIAMYLPASRATRTDPMRVLRAE